MNPERDLKAKFEKEICQKNYGGGRFKFALVYPNFYRIGMSNLGIHIIYDLLNSRPDTSCERFFLPEPKISTQMEKSNSGLSSVETQTGLNKFSAVGFAVSFEPDYFNVVKILKMGKIPVESEKRTKFDPIIIAGGPCATFNPIPLSKIIDAFVIGEGEIIMPELTDALISSENLPRSERLKKLSEIPGVFVPAFPKKVSRRFVKNLDDFPANSIIITDDSELNMYLIETARGCGRHCRFCMAGYCFRKPRNRSLEVLKKQVDAAEKFGKKIGLAGAAVSDYPKINELCEYILSKNLTMSVASFRADSVTPELVKALAAGGLKTLTIAPEAGSEKMRCVINKGITEKNVFDTVELGLAAGIKNFKLYFMIGLPFEDFSDVEGIAAMTERLANFSDTGGKITLSVNPFVPKPFTPFQRAKFAGKKYSDSALKILREKLKKFRNVEIISESPRESEIQTVLARGDEKIAEIMTKSDSEKTFRRLFKDSGIDEDFYLREYPPEEKLTWEFLDQGFSGKYLRDEFLKAQELKSTAPCFEDCRRCGVCK